MQWKDSATGSTTRKSGNDRPKTALVSGNVNYINDEYCSPEDIPGSHLSKRVITKNLNIRSFVQQIIRAHKLKAFQ